jgi:hypothetical protein
MSLNQSDKERRKFSVPTESPCTTTAKDRPARCLGYFHPFISIDFASSALLPWVLDGSGFPPSAQTSRSIINFKTHGGRNPADDHGTHAAPSQLKIKVGAGKCSPVVFEDSDVAVLAQPLDKLVKGGGSGVRREGGSVDGGAGQLRAIPKTDMDQHHRCVCGAKPSRQLFGRLRDLLTAHDAVLKVIRMDAVFVGSSLGMSAPKLSNFKTSASTACADCERGHDLVLREGQVAARVKVRARVGNGR